MDTVTGSISFKIEERFYTLQFPQRGWLAADLVQYLDDVLRASNPEIAVLKLLGYTLQISTEPPSRLAHHWVEIDLGERLLTTNSDLLRKAVDRIPPSEEDPYSPLALRYVYEALDRNDFTVKLVS